MHTSFLVRGLAQDLGGWAEEVRETHISWVFLRDGHAYKIKKPIFLGFLDFTTPEKRRAACDAEVELNARLAPDVYLGVLPVVVDERGNHRIGGPGRTVDWAVHMRRLPDEDRADARLAERAMGIADVDRIAVHLAGFHARARCDRDTTRFGTPEAIALNVRENFRQTRESIPSLLSAQEAHEIEHWQLAFLEGKAKLLRDRMREDRVRDGHGDLRLEHVYFENDQILVIDCIEFNERFRYADVCADIAFLSMDLAWHGRVDLAERLLATYARESNDFELYRLVDFYESYRAYVRGKVATMLAADEGAPESTRERAKRDARRYFLLALAAERRSLLAPIVLAIGGVLATGKSTIADHLGAAMGAPILNTDRLRKHMLGAHPTEKIYEGSWHGAYDPAFTAQVYERVYTDAKSVVCSGRPVILDASFRTASMRMDARRLAESLGVPFRFVECRAPAELCRQRLQERVHSESVSDGRVEIFDDFVAKWEPVRELTPEQHIVLDTSEPIDECMRILGRRVPMWPEGLTA